MRLWPQSQKMHRGSIKNKIDAWLSAPFAMGQEAGQKRKKQKGKNKETIVTREQHVNSS